MSRATALGALSTEHVILSPFAALRVTIDGRTPESVAPYSRYTTKGFAVSRRKKALHRAPG